MSEANLAPALRRLGYEPRETKPGLWMRQDAGGRWFADFREVPRGRFYGFDANDQPLDTSTEERSIRVAADRAQTRLFNEVNQRG